MPSIHLTIDRIIELKCTESEGAHINPLLHTVSLMSPTDYSLIYIYIKQLDTNKRDLKVTSSLLVI